MYKSSKPITLASPKGDPNDTSADAWAVDPARPVPGRQMPFRSAPIPFRKPTVCPASASLL